MGTLAKMSAALRCITVEPVLFFFMFAIFMQFSIFQDLVFKKTCLEIYNGTICANLTNYVENMVQVQTIASYWILSSTAALVVPSVVMSNLLGTWSDIYSRKLPLLLPPIGMVLASIIYILISEDCLSIGYVVLASFFMGIFGGFVGCILAVMSYVAAVSNVQNRTLRDGVLESMSFLGGTVGPFVGNAIFKAAGTHTAVFFAMMCCHLFIIAYTVTCIQEVEIRKKPDFKTLLNAENFVSGIETFAKPRDGRNRSNLFLYLLAGMIVMVVTAGELDVAYLFTKQAPLQWDHYLYSQYFGIKFGLDGLTLLLFMPFARAVGLTDPVISIIGIISKAVSLVLHGFSNTSTMMFLVAPVSMFGSLTLPAIRSALSKLVNTDEQGKMYAFVAAVENVSSLLGAILFNTLYPLTLSVFHGIIFEAAAAVLIFPLLISCFLRYRIFKDGTNQEAGKESTYL